MFRIVRACCVALRLWLARSKRRVSAVNRLARLCALSVARCYPHIGVVYKLFRLYLLLVGICLFLYLSVLLQRMNIPFLFYILILVCMVIFLLYLVAFYILLCFLRFLFHSLLLHSLLFLCFRLLRLCRLLCCNFLHLYNWKLLLLLFLYFYLQILRCSCILLFLFLYLVCMLLLICLLLLLLLFLLFFHFLFSLFYELQPVKPLISPVKNAINIIIATNFALIFIIFIILMNSFIGCCSRLQIYCSYCILFFRILYFRFSLLVPL